MTSKESKISNDLDEIKKLTISLIENQNLLKQEKDILQFLSDTSSDGYWDWHVGTGETFEKDYEVMSDRFWEMIGQDPNEMKSEAGEWMKFIFEEDLELVMTNLRKHIETKGKHNYNQIVRYKHKNGSTVKILCRGKVIKWGKNEPIRMVGTHADITNL